jgi:hypothetical protein
MSLLCYLTEPAVVGPDSDVNDAVFVRTTRVIGVRDPHMTPWKSFWPAETIRCLSTLALGRLPKP